VQDALDCDDNAVPPPPLQQQQQSLADETDTEYRIYVAYLLASGDIVEIPLRVMYWDLATDGLYQNKPLQRDLNFTLQSDHM
jgi:hypothetical protein